MVSQNADSHIQISWGWSRKTGYWDVDVKSLGKILTFENRADAEAVYMAILAAYELGKQDRSKSIRDLLGV